MQFENLDKKIREAAEQHHPPYDEKAWRKMEKLLDQQLPVQKDDRRRILLFLSLFLLIGGGILLMISHPWKTQGDAASSVVENTRKVDERNNEQDRTHETDRNQTKGTVTNDVKNRNTSPDQVNSEEPTNVNVEARQGTRSQLYSDQRNKITPKTPLAVSGKTANNPVPSTSQPTLGEVNKNNDVADQQNKVDVQLKPEPKTDVKANEEDVAKTKEEVKNQATENKPQDAAKADAKKPAKKINTAQGGNGFSFYVSAGPDVSKAGGSKTGRTTIVYGAGVGYTLNRFTLRTGLYVAKKIYWANANDYKLAYTPSPTVKFIGADANCDVLEIPVKLGYDFGFTRKGNWFASAGLSSYLMKKEKYVYTYKTATGSYPWRYETKNENKHYFSVLDLSAGYSRQINRKVSLTAEPYVEIPMTGIGAGKVQLKSGGVLFSIGVKPFRR
jgi:hypothetical protein